MNNGRINDHFLCKMIGDICGERKRILIDGAMKRAKGRHFFDDLSQIPSNDGIIGHRQTVHSCPIFRFTITDSGLCSFTGHDGQKPHRWDN